MVKALLRLCTTYICYAPIVRDSFVEHGFDAHKLRVAHNSLTNAWTVKPEERSGSETGVLFVGRLREDSRTEMLLGTVRRLHEEGVPVTLHIIGSGEREAQLKARAGGDSFIFFHGETYESERIREISRLCCMGCYPGNAGLSVIHLMSLSLPVITHNNLRTHGPEASFVRSGENGILFDHRDPGESLYQAIRQLALDRSKLAAMQREAYATFEELVNPPLSERLWSIVNADLEERKHHSPQNQSWAANSPSIGSQPKTDKP
jgi:glycosyltransferase involved in cell wall biosynthesis